MQVFKKMYNSLCLACSADKKYDHCLFFRHLCHIRSIIREASDRIRRIFFQTYSIIHYKLTFCRCNFLIKPKNTMKFVTITRIKTKSKDPGFNLNPSTLIGGKILDISSLNSSAVINTTLVSGLIALILSTSSFHSFSAFLYQITLSLYH